MQQLGQSAPPMALRDGAGGAANREQTPRRRRLDMDGPGRSLVAKRPAVYQPPVRQLPGTIGDMSKTTLTNEVAHYRDVIDAMHKWILSIESCVEDHALHLTRQGDATRRNEQSLLELTAQLPRQHA